MRHPVADQVAAAFRDDMKPVFRVLLEHRALEGVELVADEDGDGHWEPFYFHIVMRAQQSDPFRRMEAWIASAFAEATADKSSLALLAMTNSLNIIACLTSMLRLSSNYESWSRYLHGRFPRRRSRAFQHADRTDERSCADRKRAGAGGRHHAANRELASLQTRGRRADRAGEAGP